MTIGDEIGGGIIKEEEVEEIEVLDIEDKIKCVVIGDETLEFSNQLRIAINT